MNVDNDDNNDLTLIFFLIHISHYYYNCNSYPQLGARRSCGTIAIHNDLTTLPSGQTLS